LIDLQINTNFACYTDCHWFAGFEVLAAMTVKITVIFDIMPYNIMEATDYSETITVYHTTGWHIPEDRSFHWFTCWGLYYSMYSHCYATIVRWAVIPDQFQGNGLLM
jgi:hypothetical protein